MTGHSPEAQAALDLVDRQMREAQARAAKAQELAARTEALRVRVVSRNQELAATVDSLGRLVDLELSPRAMELDERALAALVVRTVADAHAQAGQQVMQWTEDAYGADSATVATMRETYLPEAPDAPPAPSAQPAHAPYLIGRPQPGPSGRQPGRPTW